jgi:hypothetical protein
MANVYIRCTPQEGCVIQKAGEEDRRFADLPSARAQNSDVATAHALLRKTARLFEDGQLQGQSSYQLTPEKRAITGEFKQGDCRYQISLFMNKTPEGQEQLGAVQVFPAHDQDVATYIDLFVSDRDPLEQSGFLMSSKLFLK